MGRSASHGMGRSRGEHRGLGYRVFVHSLIAVLLLPAVGSSRAQTIGNTGAELVGKVAPNGDLVALFAPGLFGDTPASDGDELYADSLDFAIYHPGTLNSSGATVRQFIPSTTTETVTNRSGNLTTNETVTVPVYLEEVWANSSLVLPNRGIASGSLVLPAAPVLRSLWVTIDGTSWNFTHLTLPSSLPYGALTNGDADFFAVGIAVESLVVAWLAISAAESAQRRGQGWAPRFRTGIAGAIVGIPSVLLAVFYYPQLDIALGGVSFLAYPALFAPLFFLAGLYKFNRGDVGILFRPDVSSDATKFSMHVFQPRFSAARDGRLIYVEESWAGWFKGTLGHVTYVHARVPKSLGAAIEGPPALLPLYTSPARLPDGRHRVLYRRLRFRRRGDGRRLLPGVPRFEQVIQEIPGPAPELRALIPVYQERLFGVTNAEPGPNQPHWVGWLDADARFDVVRPRLTVHRLEAVRGPDGQQVRDPDGAGEVRRRIAWPHFEPADGRAVTDLSGVHWVHQARVLQGVKGLEDVTKALEARTMQVFALKAELRRARDRGADVYTDVVDRVVSRADEPATEQQIRDEVEAWGRRDRDRPEERSEAPSGRDGEKRGERKKGKK